MNYTHAVERETGRGKEGEAGKKHLEREGGGRERERRGRERQGIEEEKNF